VANYYKQDNEAYTNSNGRVINALNEMMQEAKVRNGIPQGIRNSIFQRAKEKYSEIRCENQGCNNPQPFFKQDNSVYLEFHHIQEVSDGGNHEVGNLVLLCSNCHSEVHYGKYREEINNKLRCYV
jgi:5-methylcytosine-specific restriction endonuclease McrA